MHLSLSLVQALALQHRGQMKQIILVAVIILTFFSIDIFAQLKPSQAQGLDRSSLLANSEFEQGKTGWDITQTGCTVTTPKIADHNIVLRLTCTAGTFSVKQSKALNIKDGQNISNQIMYTTDTLGAKWATLSNDIRISTLDLSVSTKPQNSSPISNTVNATSNGVEIFADSVFTGVIDVVIVNLENKDLTNKTGNISKEEPYTPVLTGFGASPSAVEFTYRINGSRIDISGGFNSDTPTATTASISLPAGYTIKTNVPASNLNVGTAIRGVAEIENNDFRMLAANGASVLTIGVVNSTSYVAIDSRLGNDIVGTGNYLSIKASVEVNELSAPSVLSVTQDTTLTKFTENRPNVVINPDGTIKSDTYSVLSGNCNNPSAGRYNCDYASLNLNHEPAIQCSNEQADRGCSYESLTSTSVTIYVTNTSGTRENREFSFDIIKQLSDVNKTLPVKGSFENLGKTKADTLNLTSIDTYVDDAAAGVGGLISGDVYKTATGELRIKL